jgi:hypothetical protein
MTTEKQIKARLKRNFDDAQERCREYARETDMGFIKLHMYHSGRADAIVQSYAEVFDLTFARAFNELRKD